MLGSAFDEDALSINACVRLVRCFHQRIRAPIAATPQTLKCDPASALAYSDQLAKLSKEMADAANGTKDMLLCRCAMALEEISEWLVAHSNGDLAAAADALGDRLFLLIGDAVAAGMPLAENFERVYEANSTKLKGVVTGHGKAVKGPGYQAPDLAELLAQCAAARRCDRRHDGLADEL